MRDKGRKIFLFWRCRIYRDDRAQAICLKHATLLQVFREPGRTWSNLREQGPTVLYDSKDPDLGTLLKTHTASIAIHQNAMEW